MRPAAITNPFAVDLRSLAALRIGLALCLFWELGDRLPDLGAFYTDAGVLPRAEFLAFSADRVAPTFSLAFMGGALWVQLLLFAATAVAAAALLVGYRTWSATFLSWLLLSSMQLRNPFVVFGADVFLRMLLFWGMFLPLGARLSLDQPPASQQPAESKAIFSIATCGLVSQIAVVFIIAGLAKWANPAWRDGLGVAHSLDYQAVATRLGGVLAQFPALCSAISYAVIAIELGGVALLFSPILAAPLRILALAAMSAMLAGFGLTLRVGLFPWVSFVALLTFVPGSVWDRFGVAAVLSGRSGPAARQTAGRGREGARRSPAALGAEALAAAALVSVVVWNIGLWRDPDFRPPAVLAGFGEFLNLRQKWGMFTRLPSTGWLLLPGTLRNGMAVELLSAGGPLPDYDEAVTASGDDGQPPSLVSATFRSVPWLVFFLGITEDPAGASGQLLSYGRYLCRQWNAREAGARQLHGFDVVYMSRPVGPASAASEPVERQVLWTHRCFD
jgi:hypothetical protein